MQAMFVQENSFFGIVFLQRNQSLSFPRLIVDAYVHIGRTQRRRGAIGGEKDRRMSILAGQMYSTAEVTDRVDLFDHARCGHLFLYTERNVDVSVWPSFAKPEGFTFVLDLFSRIDNHRGRGFQAIGANDIFAGLVERVQMTNVVNHLADVSIDQVVLQEESAPLQSATDGSERLPHREYRSYWTARRRYDRSAPSSTAAKKRCHPGSEQFLVHSFRDESNATHFEDGQDVRNEASAGHDEAVLPERWFDDDGGDQTILHNDPVDE